MRTRERFDAIRRRNVHKETKLGSLARRADTSEHSMLHVPRTHNAVVSEMPMLTL